MCPSGVDTPETTFHGEWVDQDCKSCTVNVSGSGCLCVVFKCGGCPFSCTPVAKAGSGVYANFQGYCLVYDGTDLWGQYLCAKSKLVKKESGGGPPTSTAMER